MTNSKRNRRKTSKIVRTPATKFSHMQKRAIKTHAKTQKRKGA